MVGIGLKKQIAEQVAKEMKVKFVEIQKQVCEEYNTKLLSKLDGWDVEVKKYLKEAAKEVVEEYMKNVKSNI